MPKPVAGEILAACHAAQLCQELNVKDIKFDLLDLLMKVYNFFLKNNNNNNNNSNKTMMISIKSHIR